MNRLSSRGILPVVGSIVFLFAAPGLFGVFIPWYATGWRMHEPGLGFEPLRWLGGALILFGAATLLDSFARFALQGRGTPAPIYPTATLVVSGAYRYVRNPMYLAVTALIAGQGLLVGSPPLLLYALAFGVVTHLFVLAYEEPTLRGTYGAQYETYAANDLRQHRVDQEPALGSSVYPKIGDRNGRPDPTDRCFAGWLYRGRERLDRLHGG